MLLSSLTRAQPGKEAWHWNFGRGSTLDFSSGVPVPGPGNNFQTGEGSASYSDPATGTFLLGAMSSIVFNNSLNLMTNGFGLFGHSSTTQSDLIVPKPGNANIFYIVTADQAIWSNKGVHYSEADISFQSGWGKVTLKNKLLSPSPCTEKLVGVRHCNGEDFWVLTHPFLSNAFKAYRVSSQGIDSIPVISNSGTAHMGYGGWLEAIGYMKASPDGKRLAIAVQSDSIPMVEVFDFNNATGVVSNPITISYYGVNHGAYGVSFSPDNTKLYVSVSGINDSTTAIYQYDLNAGTPAAIVASQTQLAQIKMYKIGLNSYANQFGALQLGPDGKIYISMSKDTLSYISNPNVTGSGCGFVLNGLPIKPVYYTYSFGLPNFMDAYYAGIQLNIPDVYHCSTFTVAALDAGPGYSGYQWSTGATTQTISVTNPGQYWVTVTNDQGCQRTDTVGAYVVQPMNIDTSVCDSFVANLAQAGAVQYNWYDSTSNPIKSITQSGNYYADVTFQGGCTLRDSVSVSVITSPKVELGPPLSLCDFQLSLDASYPGVSFNWSTGATTPSVTVNQPGVYWVTLQNSSGCTGTDTLAIGPPWQLIDLLLPNIVTPNADKINDEIDFTKFQFSAFTISIYNRWGQKMFESDSPGAVWRPEVEDGTYFYTGQYKIDCGTATQVRDIKGFITVVR